MSAYLSAAGRTFPARATDHRKALGPRCWAGDETSSARIRTDHGRRNTAKIRAEIGPDPVVARSWVSCSRPIPTAPEAIAREHLSTYLELPNYVNNWLRTGFTPDDGQHGGSDRLSTR